MSEASKARLVPYAITARRDFRFWAMLFVGIMFAWAGYTVDPATNCDDSGNCAPWLVPIAWAIGMLATFCAIALLWHNHERGSYIDIAAGELVWWTSSKDHAERYPIADISCIRIDLGSDSDDIHVYHRKGERIGFAGTEVVRWPYQDWAKAIGDRYPHIVIEIRDV
jgi:hypothetical protein